MIAPSKGAKKGSTQASATNSIMANRALNTFRGGFGGAGGGAQMTAAGFPNAPPPLLVQGLPGADGKPGNGIGGGVFLDPAGSATIDNTSITGNTASTTDNNVHDTFST